MRPSEILVICNLVIPNSLIFYVRMARFLGLGDFVLKQEFSSAGDPKLSMSVISKKLGH